MQRLIIVESPSKARTLARFLGSEYIVLASMGHVRDLPKSKMGVDVEGGFVPQYELIKGKEKQIRDLRAAAKKATSTLLAADPDREGEAIAWHLAEALGLRDPDRIVFHEITKLAVDAALAHPRKIDRSLVAAQEARRVIDRLVGYRLSPLLWRKVRAGLSAGRVQSVAVRLVVDRETEIDAFVPVESWTIDALLEKDGSNPLTARLVGRRGDTDTADREKLELGSEAEAKEVIAALALDDAGAVTAQTPPFVVRSIDVKETSRRPLPPHTTSTLQQDASSRLRMSPKRTMSIAQELYEGVELGSAGSTGLITYMRTDSIRISDAARDDAAQHITAEYGKEYVGSGAVRATKKSPVNVQDAHEAIRPTDVRRTPDSVGASLSPGQLKVYDLIWRRFVASQMSPAKYLNTSALIDAVDYVFRASGSLVTFEGFQKVWKRDDDKEKDTTLPALTEREALRCLEITSEQHFTQPPPRFTEATLIKELEERGIGRPSTYAATIEVIQERQYVKQVERRLHPTELGKTVDSVLRQNFPEIVDVAFTADLEKRLDSVEEGTREYEPTVREWYEPFAETLERAERSMERVRVPARETGEECPECELGQLVVREGKFGEFIGCSRFPECKYIKDRKKSEAVATGELCPLCEKPLVTRQGRRGPFVGCSGYPSCTYIKDDRAPAMADGAEPEVLGACPTCGKPLRRRSGRRGSFVGCSGYPDCKYIQPDAAGARPAGPAPEPTGDACPECSKPLVTRKGRYGPFVSCSGYPACKYRPPKTAHA